MTLKQFQLSTRYRKFILFKSSHQRNIVPQWLFWGAVVTIFSIVHLPKDRVQAFVTKILQSLPPQIFETLFAKEDSQDIAANYMAGGIVNKLIIPLKEFLFLVAFLVIAYPILRAIWRSRSFWYQIGIKKIAITSFAIFLILSMLVFPGGLNDSGFGLVGMGPEYARMSLNPFSENTGWYYRRLLKPAIAHFVQMDTPIRYYVLSLIGSYLLILMTLVFLESKTKNKNAAHIQRENNTRKSTKLKGVKKLLFYTSIATSIYLIGDFLWPGYSDQISYILILLMACIPMNQQTKLAVITLCMINHEASAFSLVPIAFFCFHKRERNQSFLVILLYIILWAASYGLRVDNALAVHTVIHPLQQDDTTSLQLLIENYGAALVGIFFTYKLLWIVLIYICWFLWSKKELATLLAILSMIILPFFTLPVACDATRLVGLGFLGMLISAAILMDEYQTIPKPISKSLLILIFANILLPSYSVVLVFPESIASYSYPGIYNFIDTSLRSVLPI